MNGWNAVQPTVLNTDRDLGRFFAGVPETVPCAEVTSLFAKNCPALRALLRSDVADTSHRERALEGGCSI